MWYVLVKIGSKLVRKSCVFRVFEDVLIFYVKFLNTFFS